LFILLLEIMFYNQIIFGEPVKFVNKRKIINDPLYGLLAIPTDLVFDIIEHPYFQRLRRIKQLGLTDFVYPGAIHTRFHHAIGAMHLMGAALENLRLKGIDVSEEEYEASLCAILLHDIGHGPFSHTLELSFFFDTNHEDLSLVFFDYFNQYFSGKLSLAVQIFKNEYGRKFFHQLVASQLDVDRLDYLSRDSFFTGVSEGTIGVDRIIKMINVVNDELVVEEKGIYSIENFLSARRLMYWQVYFHKTTVGIEKMLKQLISRAKHLSQKGDDLYCSPALKLFLQENVAVEHFKRDEKYLKLFAALDDYDVWGAIKFWCNHEDQPLSILSRMILDRRLFKVLLTNKKLEEKEIVRLKKKVLSNLPIGKDEWEYFLVSGSMSNAAYLSRGEHINILKKNGEVVDIAHASDLPNIKAMSKIVKKYYLCWPKSLSL
jgi:uncharacterized protein